jgi:3-oxoacyl-[acyl-carrier-protein] synthase-3
MGAQHAAKLTGTGSAFPETRVSNDELALKIETSDAWIRERTGIRERRISRRDFPEERNSGLALKAALRALEMAGREPAELDAILFGTCTPDTLIPSTAAWLQMKLGARNAWAMDVNAACSGFLFALATADAWIRAGRLRKVLVLGSDVLSAFTDWTDRGSCVLFGDGSGAAIVERTDGDDPSRIYSTHLGSDGSLTGLFHIPAGGSNEEVTPEVYAQRRHKMQMKGKEIFRVAVKTLVDYAQAALEENELKPEALDWVVPHQANLRIIEAVAKRLGIPMEKVLLNIERFGNTSAATIPTVLDEAVRDGRIGKGQLILLDTFGAGLTYASALLRW